LDHVGCRGRGSRPSLARRRQSDQGEPLFRLEGGKRGKEGESRVFAEQVTMEKGGGKSGIGRGKRKVEKKNTEEEKAIYSRRPLKKKGKCSPFLLDTKENKKEKGKNEPSKKKKGGDRDQTFLSEKKEGRIPYCTTEKKKRKKGNVSKALGASSRQIGEKGDRSIHPQ